MDEKQKMDEYLERARTAAEGARAAAEGARVILYPVGGKRPGHGLGHHHSWGVGTPPSDDGYDSLRAVLARAVEQAAGGKGAERHANGQPFDRQPICEGGRRFGPTCLVYQAWKKAHEVPALLKMDNPKERAVRELLGMINYAAAAIIVIEES